MENRKLLSALIGLAGAVSNNGKTDNTDRTVCVALLSQDTNQAVEMVHREKFLISPDCASCQSPCGNTSDYDLSVVEQEEKQIRELKEQVLELLHHVAVRGLSGVELPDTVYRGLSYLKYEHCPQMYEDLIEELRNWLGM